MRMPLKGKHMGLIAAEKIRKEYQAGEVNTFLLLKERKRNHPNI